MKKHYLLRALLAFVLLVSFATVFGAAAERRAVVGEGTKAVSSEMSFEVQELRTRRSAGSEQVIFSPTNDEEGATRNPIVLGNGDTHFEGFEGTDFPPASWTMLTLGDSRTQWYRNTTVYSNSMGPYSGTAYAQSASWTNEYDALNANNWLITPPITIEATNANRPWFLSYAVASLSGPEWPDQHTVYWTTGDPTDTSSYSILSPTHAPQSGWELKLINLEEIITNITDAPFYIAFRHHDYDGDCLLLDAVEIRQIGTALVSVSGTVVTAGTNAPIEGATVVLTGGTINVAAITSATGAFLFTDLLPEFTYTLTISATGHLTYTNNAVAVGENDVNLGNIALEPIDEVVYIGDPSSGSGSVEVPFNFYYKESLAQSIYPGTTIPDGAVISHIDYDFLNVDTPAGKPIKIWMATTSAQSSFTGTADWIPYANFTLVYDGTFASGPAGAITRIIIPLDTPYNYDTGNLVIMTQRVFDPANTYYAQGNLFRYTPTTLPQTIYNRSDDAGDINPQSPSGGYTSTALPNISIYYTPGTPPIIVSVSGTVVDAVSSNPISGATVSMTGQPTTTTNASGAFTFANVVGNNTYTLTVIASGYASYTNDAVTVGETDVNVGTIPLSSMSITLNNGDTHFEGFEGIVFPPDGWSTLELGTPVSPLNKWTRVLAPGHSAFEGEASAMSPSYVNNVGAFNADNWLITPMINIEATADNASWCLRFAAASQNASWLDQLSVHWTAGDPTVSTGYQLLWGPTVMPTEWQTILIDLEEVIDNITATPFYIAFRHNDYDQYSIKVDAVELLQRSTDMSLNPPTELSAAAGSNTVILSWTAPVTGAELSHYNVYRNGSLLNIAGGTTYQDYDLINNIPVSYYVTAVYSDPVGVSVASNTVEALPVGPTLVAYPVRNLTANLSGQDVVLNWDIPKFEPIGEWFTHCVSDAPWSSIGNGMAANYGMAQRFSPAHLAEMGVAGEELSYVSFIPSGDLSIGSTYTIQIYTGGTSVTNPGTLVHSQLWGVSTVETAWQWVNVPLSTPVTIPTNQELRIAVMINAVGGYAAVYNRDNNDGVPVLTEYGDLFYWNGWYTVPQVVQNGVPVNFCIKGFVASEDGNPSPIPSPVVNTWVDNAVSPPLPPLQMGAVIERTPTRNFQTYKVYRAGVELDVVTTTTYTVDFDEDFSGLQTFSVTAVYETVGESAPVDVEINIPAQPITVAQRPSNWGTDDAGTATNPYLIANLANLRWLSETPEEWWLGENTQVHFSQTADIDATESIFWNNGEGFRPIGYTYNMPLMGAEGEIIYALTDWFVGVYNGNNNTISNLYINKEETVTRMGLFAALSNSEIRNLNLTGIDMSALGYDVRIGAVAGYVVTNTTIDNISATGSIVADGTTILLGGLVGILRINSTISNSESSVNIINDGFNGRTGGIVGEANTLVTIVDCSADGELVGTTNDYTGVGGIVGNTANTTIEDCSFTGSVVVTSYGGSIAFAGGIAGNAQPGVVITNCHTDATITAYNDDVNSGGTGGIAGNINTATIENSYSTSTISGRSYVGGVVGSVYNNSLITDCYFDGAIDIDLYAFATASIAGYMVNSSIVNCHSGAAIDTGALSGGLVGVMYGSSISNSCFGGTFVNATNPTNTVGGLVGHIGGIYEQNSANSITNSYSTAYIFATNGGGGIVGGISSSEVTGLTTTTITNTFATGLNGATIAGGIVGFVNDRDILTIVNSYWDTQTTGVAANAFVGTGTGTFSGGGKLTSEMQNSATYSGWNFTDIWTINSALNGGYPHLQGITPTDPPEPPDYWVSVTGTVVDSANNSAISGAVVTLGNYTTTTNAVGIFTFDNILINSVYTLTITANGYATYTNNAVTVGETDVNLGNIALNMIPDIPYPPTNVVAREVGNSVRVDWNQPRILTPGDHYFTHTTSGFESAYGGSNGGPMNWTVMHRYTQTQLWDLGIAGTTLSEVGFFPYNDYDIPTNATFTIKVYTGGSGNPLSPGTLVHSQVVQSYQIYWQNWTDIPLTADITIPMTGELWIGYEVNSQAGFPVSVDGGPVRTGYGDIIYYNNNWTTFTQLGIRVNFMISGTATIAGRRVAIANMSYPDAERPYTLTGTDLTGDFDSVSITPTRLLESYNIYRALEANLGDEALWTELATGVEGTAYIDNTWNTAANGYYKYLVKAVYTNEISTAAVSNTVFKGTLGVPTGLSAVAGNNQVDLSWTAPTGERTPVGYAIYRDDAFKTAVTTTSYTDDMLVNGITYSYFVTAIYDNPYGESAPTATVTATPVGPTAYPYPPRNLTASLNGQDVILDWDMPEYVPGDTFSHCVSDQYWGSIGTGGVGSYGMAQRFSPAQLNSFGVTGRQLSHISFVPGDASSIGSTFTIRIYTGGTNPTNPGTLVHEQVWGISTAETAEQWVTMALNTTVTIPTNQELWIAVMINAAAGYAAAYNNDHQYGNAVNGYGDLFYFNGSWNVVGPLLTGNPVYNFAIKGIAAFDSGTRELAGSIPARNGLDISQQTMVEASPTPTEVVSQWVDTNNSRSRLTFSSEITGRRTPNTQNSPTRNFQTYKVYRNDLLLDTVASTSYTVSFDSDYTGMQTFSVTAVYETVGESEPISTQINIPATPLTDAQRPSNWGTANAGSASNPYLIANLGNLRWLSEVPEDWWIDEDTAIHFTQTANINASESVYWNNGDGFRPIGAWIDYLWSENSTLLAHWFMGVYDGGNYTISNLYINSSTNAGRMGLFGATHQAEIKNVNLVNIDYTVGGTEVRVGGIAAFPINGTEIRNSSVSGTITGQGSNLYAGGIAGFTGYTASIHNSSSSVNITYSGNELRLGGISGMLHYESLIVGSYFTGSIAGNSSSSIYAGGLIGSGWFISQVLNSYSTGDVSAEAYEQTYVGGIAGYIDNNTSINDSYATGYVQGNSTRETFVFAGGVSGYTVGASIANSYSTGNVRGTSIGAAYVAGVSGYASEATITNCYSTGNITSINYHSEARSSAGGVVGEAWSGTNISMSHSTGTITSHSINYSAFVGGVVGLLSNSYVNSCYSTGLVIGENTPFPRGGGIAGHTQNASIIQNSYSIATIRGSGTVDIALGGISAYLLSGSTIQDCYSRSNISSVGTYTDDYLGGGIAGYVAASNITKSYFAGSVGGVASGQIYYVRAIAAYLVNQASVSISVWDTQVTGLTLGTNNIDGTATITAVNGLTTAYMKQEAAYAVLGWDFTNTWAISEDINSGYPYLQGMTPDDPEALNPVQNLSVQVSGNNVILTWSAPVRALTNYQVYRGETLLATLPTTTLRYIDAQVPVGQYVYSVVAIYDGGASEPAVLNVIVPSAGRPINFGQANAGTALNPYRIANLANLQWLSEHTYDWWIDDTTPVHFVQTANIDATETVNWNGGAGFKPIGYPAEIQINEETIAYANWFTGVYNGGNFTISNLYINAVGEGIRLGMFGATIEAELKNIRLTNIDYTGSGTIVRIGGIVAFPLNNTMIENCSVTGTINGNGDNLIVGGIAGLTRLGTTINNSHFIGDIATTGTGIDVGGITGALNSNAYINNCYAIGEISLESIGSIGMANRAGGITGHLATGSEINNSYTNNNVFANSPDHVPYAGGIAGVVSDYATVYNSYATGDISASSLNLRSFAGGIAGGVFTNAIISNSYATGSIYSISVAENAYVGGITGTLETNSFVSSSYSTGNIRGESNLSRPFVGGIAGLLWNISSVSNSHSTGDIQGASEGNWTFVGGVVGRADSESNVAHSYSTGTVSATTVGTDNWTIAGGITGWLYNSSTLACYSTATVNSTGDYFTVAGGIVGYLNSGSVVGNSYYAGGVLSSISSFEAVAGGIAGQLDTNCNINNSYASGEILLQGTDDVYGGGIAGRLCYSSNVDKSYATNMTISIPTVNAYAGGLIGSLDNEATLSNSVFDTQTMGLTEAVGRNVNCTVTNTAGLTTAQMKQMTSYTSRNWDFEDIWAMAQNINYGYPYIQNNVPPETPVGGMPQNLTLTLSGRNVIMVWEAPEETTSGYNVYRDGLLLTAEAILDTTFTDRGLIADSLYTYSVEAVYEYGVSEAVTETIIVPVFNPAQNLRAISGMDRAVELRWTTPEAQNYGEVVSYELFRDDSLLVTVTEVVYLDEDLTNGTEYEYYVVAIYGGEITGAALPSNTAVGRPQAGLVPVASVNTTLVEENVVISWVEPTDLRLQASDLRLQTSDVAEILRHRQSDDETGLLRSARNDERMARNDEGSTRNDDEATRNILGYNVYKNEVLLTAEPITALTYTDSTVAKDQLFIYAVSVVYEGGESVAINADDFFIPIYNPARSLVATVINPNTADNAVSLIWQAPVAQNFGTVSGYMIVRDETDTLATVNALSYLDETVTADTQYSYSVTAIYNDIQGQADPVETTIIVPLFNPVTGLIADVIDGRVYLEWTAPDATNYGNVYGYSIYKNDTIIAMVFGVTNFTDTNVFVATEYMFSVRAMYQNPTGMSEAMAVSALVEIAGAIIDDSVYLTWVEPETRSTVLGYNVIRDTELLEFVEVNYYFDTTVEVDNQYTYDIVVVWDVEPVDPTTLSITLIVPVFTPVTALNASLHATETATVLNWTIPAAQVHGTHTGYVIKREGEIVAEIGTDCHTGTTATYTDDTVAIGNLYHYEVLAVYAEPDGHSIPVATEIIVPGFTPVTALSSALANSIVTLTWTAPVPQNVGTLAEYKVQRGGTDLVTLDATTFTTNTITYADDTIELDRQYTYAVQAVYDDPDGLSQALTTTIIVPIYNPPLALEAVSGQDDTIILTWDAPATQNFGEVVAYRVYRDNLFIEEVVDRTYTDNDIEYLVEYSYTVTAVYGGDIQGESAHSVAAFATFVDEQDEVITTIAITELMGNYPNPFNPSTTIAFSVGTQNAVSVQINIYNIKGQKVRTLVNGVYTSGQHKIVWNGNDDNGRSVSSGVYFYRMQTDGFVQTKKMLLMK